MDIKQEGMKIPKVEYEVYSKLSGTNLTKLNLSLCENSKIFINIPLILNDTIDKFNSKSGYYNDICYTTTSENGTDVTLADRKEEFKKGNKTICQDDCDFEDYDNYILQAKCSCKVKESSPSFANMTINITKIITNFKDIEVITNLNILECYKKLFNKNGIKLNVGCYIISIIIIIHLICGIIFYTKQFDLLEKMVKDMVYALTNIDLFKKRKKRKKNLIGNSQLNQ